MGLTEATSAGIVIIYPVTSNSLDCTGTITGVEYCYKRVGMASNIFTLLILRENTEMFRIARVIPIPRPPSTDETCNGMECCGLHSFTSTEQFELPISNFAFGVLDPSGGHELFGFHNTLVEFQTSQYHYTASSLSLNVNATISKSECLEGRTLRIVRFVVGKWPLLSIIHTVTFQKSHLMVPQVLFQPIQLKP